MIETLIVSPGHASPVEARATDPDEPGRRDGGWDSDYAAAAYAFHSFGMWDAWQEGAFDPTRALTYSVVWACVSYISQTIASLGWHQYERQERGQRKLPLEDPISWLLGVQACPECNAFDWRQVMLKDALLWGNGYAEIERTGAGRPYWMWRLDPSRVCPERDDAGALYYRVRNDPGDGDTFLDPADVFHLKGESPDGLVGYSVLRLARRSIELGLQQEQFGSTFFKKGPMPGGVLEIPGVMKKPDRDELRSSFEKTYGGSRNAGKVVVLTGGAKFNPLSMPNDDAQWIEGRTFQAEDVTRWFRVPPHKVGLLNRATFSNIEQQSIEAVQDCLLPWCRRLESEADVKLFGRNQMGRRYTRLNLDSLLRGDSATQTTTVVQKVNNGILTPNEGREYFDKNPIPGGDTPLVQGAMVPLERVLEEPEPAPAPAPPAAEPPEEEGQMPVAAWKAFRGLFAECYQRLLRVEAEKAKRAAKDGRLREWAESFYGPHEEHVACRVVHLVEALLLALGRAADAPALAARLAALHVAEGRARPPALPEVAARAAAQAEAHLWLLWETIADCGGKGGTPGPCPGSGKGKGKGKGKEVATAEQKVARAKEKVEKAKDGLLKAKKALAEAKAKEKAQGAAARAAAGKAKAAAPVDAKKQIRETRALYERYRDPKLTVKEIQDHCAALAKNSNKAQLVAVARDLGIGRTLPNKEAYRKAIEQKIVGRKGAWERPEA